MCLRTFVILVAVIFGWFFIGVSSTSTVTLPNEASEEIRYVTEHVLYDFSLPYAYYNWYRVNDNVMGGVSQSTLTATDAGTAQFSGTISFENNGGFASVEGRFDQPLDLSAYDGIALRLRGDGKQYGVYLYDAQFRRISHQATFVTLADTWQTVELPFTAFVPIRFGQPVRAALLDTSRIHAMSFMIEYGQEGAFALEVRSVTAYTQPEDSN